MALQILPTPPSVGEGYGRLGDALLQGSRDYMNQKLASDHEDKLRQQALADLAAQQQYQQGLITNTRAYNDQRFNVERQAKLEDATTLAEAAQRRDEIEKMIQAGIITREEVADPAKLSAAYKKAQAIGLIKAVAPIIGSGYLDAAEAGDPVALARALNTQGAEASKGRADVLKEKSDAGVRQTAIEKQKRVLQDQASKITNVLSTPTPRPTDQDYEAEATRLAQQQLDAKGETAHWYGGGPAKANKEQIAAMLPSAKQQLDARVQDQDYIVKERAKAQEQFIQTQLQDLRAEQGALISKFGQVADPSALQAAAPSKPDASSLNVAKAPVVPTPEARAAALAQASGTQPPPANLVGMRIPTENQQIGTTNVTGPAAATAQSILNAENQRRAGVSQETLIAQPLRQTAAQLDDIDRQIAQTVNTPDAPLGGAPVAFGPMGAVTSNSAFTTNPGNKAVRLGNLYKQRAVAQKQLTDLQARLQPAPLPATQPVQINAATNAPTFADPVANDTGAMGTGRIAPWNQNQFNVAPAGTPY